MTRLVKNRAANLNREKVGQLWELIDTSRRNSKKFYELCKATRELVKRGHTGELNKIPKSEQVIVNLAHAHVRTKLPTIFFREPSANTKPTHPRHEGKDLIWKSLLNNTAKRIGIKKEAKAAVRDALIYPEGWIKVGLNKVPSDGELQGTEPRSAEESGPTTEMGSIGPVEWLSLGSPVVNRVSPLQVVVDYRSKDRSLENARFVDFMYVKTLDELKADPRYSIPSDVFSAEGTLGMHQRHAAGEIFDPIKFIDEGNTSTPTEMDQFVVLHEVWVYQIVGLNLYKQVVVLLEGADGLIHNKPIRLVEGRIPGFEDLVGTNFHRFPCFRLVLTEVSDELPNSELGVWSSMHSAINWMMSRQVQFVENQRQIFEVRTSAITNKDNLERKFAAAGPRTLIEVNENGAVTPVPNHGSTRDDSILFGTLMDMIRRVGGVSENQQQGDRFRTATAASVAAQASAIKTDEEIDTVGVWLSSILTEIARRIVTLVQESGDTSFVFQVAGETGAVEWLEFTPNDINWMPDVDIEAGSFTKPTKEEQAQKALMAYQALLQAMQVGVPSRIEVVLRQVLEALEIKDIGKILDSSTDHMMLQAVEIAMIMAGADVPTNPDDNHAVHSQVITMFLNSDQARELATTNGDALNALMVHKDEHDQALQQVGGGGGSNSGTQNIFEFNQVVGTPANIAREETAREREATGGTQGLGGQLR